MVQKIGLDLFLDRDLGSEYRIIAENYKGHMPPATVTAGHQGWLGARMRQTVDGMI